MILFFQLQKDNWFNVDDKRLVTCHSGDDLEEILDPDPDPVLDPDQI